MSDEDERQVEVLAQFRSGLEQRGYVEEGSWHNNREIGFGVKSGSSYRELWLQVYRIGDGPRRPVDDPIHFHGHYTEGDMLAVVAKAESDG